MFGEVIDYMSAIKNEIPPLRDCLHLTFEHNYHLQDGGVLVGYSYTLQVQERISLHYNYSLWANISNTCTYLQII